MKMIRSKKLLMAAFFVYKYRLVRVRVCISDDMSLQGQSSFGIVDGSADFMLSYPISFSLLALYHVKAFEEMKRDKGRTKSIVEGFLQ
ncbi:MAG: hypothetical protein ACE3K2_22475 [Paenibacillus sp.]|uniref:hypothetical protein n=1 Tax=Paenibacillus sp. TaxID=58172 RepID=UPI003B7D1CC2